MEELLKQILAELVKMNSIMLTGRTINTMGARGPSGPTTSDGGPVPGGFIGRPGGPGRSGGPGGPGGSSPPAG